MRKEPTLTKERALYLVRPAPASDRLLKARVLRDRIVFSRKPFPSRFIFWLIDVFS